MGSILFLHRGGDAIRGSEACLIEAVQAVASAGATPILLCNHPDSLRPFLPAGVIVERLEFPELMVDGPYRSFPVVRYARALKALSGRFRSSDVRLIFANGGLPCQLGWPLSRALCVPLLASVYHPAPRRYFYFWLVRLADLIVAPSQYTAAVIRAKCGRESIVVYPGVDTREKFFVRERDPSVRAALGFSDEDVVVGQVGALEPNKRADLLLRAFGAVAASIPELRLVLVGGGKMQGELVALADALGVGGRVRIPGRVRDTPPYYQDVFDINVLASDCEGLGISVVEASACGVPSVVSDSTGLLEVVEHGVTGVHFRTGDQDALGKCLSTLARDPALRQKLGRQAVDFAARKFSLRSYRDGVVRQVRSLRGFD